LNADSRNAHKPKIAVNTIAGLGNSSKENKRIRKLKKIPILAAKILGPALVVFGLTCRDLSINLANKANGLNLPSSTPRKVKSNKRNKIGKTFSVSK